MGKFILHVFVILNKDAKLNINPYIWGIENRVILMQSNVRKLMLSSLLTFVLLLPYIGSFSHLFEDHDHKTCEILETHLHEIELECDILDYQLAPSIEIFGVVAKLIAVVPYQKKCSYYCLGDSFPIDTYDSLRGPPAV